jgi:hypothetical protein
MITADDGNYNLGKEPGTSELNPNRKFPVGSAFFTCNTEPVERPYESEKMTELKPASYTRRPVFTKKYFYSTIICRRRVDVIQNLPVSCLRRVSLLIAGTI